MAAKRTRFSLLLIVFKLEFEWGLILVTLLVGFTDRRPDGAGRSLQLEAQWEIHTMVTCVLATR